MTILPLPSPLTGAKTPMMLHTADVPANASLTAAAGGAEAVGAPRPSAEASTDGLLDGSRELALAVARFADDPEYRQFGPGQSTAVDVPANAPPVDFLFAADSDPADPDAVFARLRWGGLFVYASRNAGRVADVVRRFVARGYAVDRPQEWVRRPFLGMRLPLLSPRVHYAVLRKVSLTLPKQISERFTYHVELTRDHVRGPDALPFVVMKEVPTHDRVVARLRHKFPDASEELVDRRARKFTDKIFPLFLTREAAMLKILERHLSPEYRVRVPRVLDLEQDGRGFVRKMWVNWLRAAPPGGKPLTQMQFAFQAADLLRAVHEEAKVIHLDLRLDNFVVTDRGVGFVDFGSSVRFGENIKGNPLLATIFDELMRTSQIQRMLERMTMSGAVTSQVFSDAHGKVDQAVDLFYLAIQVNQPLANGEFLGLVQHDPLSRESLALEGLTERVLKPRDPANPPVRTARDLLRAIELIAERLKSP